MVRASARALGEGDGSDSAAPLAGAEGFFRGAGLGTGFLGVTGGPKGWMAVSEGLGFEAGSAKGDGGASDAAGNGRLSLRNGPGSEAEGPTVSAGMPRLPAATVAARKISVAVEEPGIIMREEGGTTRATGASEVDDAIAGME